MRHGRGRWLAVKCASRCLQAPTDAVGCAGLPPSHSPDMGLEPRRNGGAFFRPQKTGCRWTAGREKPLAELSGYGTLWRLVAVWSATSSGRGLCPERIREDTAHPHSREQEQTVPRWRGWGIMVRQRSALYGSSSITPYRALSRRMPLQEYSTSPVSQSIMEPASAGISHSAPSASTSFSDRLSTLFGKPPLILRSISCPATSTCGCPQKHCAKRSQYHATACHAQPYKVKWVRENIRVQMGPR